MRVRVTALSGIYYSSQYWQQGNFYQLSPPSGDITGHSKFPQYHTGTILSTSLLETVSIRDNKSQDGCRSWGVNP